MRTVRLDDEKSNKFLEKNGFINMDSRGNYSNWISSGITIRLTPDMKVRDIHELIDRVSDISYRDGYRDGYVNSKKDISKRFENFIIEKTGGEEYKSEREIIEEMRLYELKNPNTSSDVYCS
jgi:hypothetical protein